MANRKGLTRLITTYAVMELLYTFFVMIFFFLLLNILVNTGIVYPANYPESQLGKVEKDFKSESWTPDQLPFFYEYEYMKNGQVVSSNISETYQPYVKKAQETARASKDSFIGARVFRYYTTNDKELVVSYKLSPFFASQKLNQLIPHFEGVYFLVVFFVWISGFLFLIVRLTKILKREIKKISTASVYIQQQNLDYPRINSDYKEINDVLSTIDLLANDLKKSLQEQWQMQETKRDLIESVTHDIRTPITLIKGNLELLDEEALTASSSERVKDIEKGVSRLEVYVERLKQISSHVTEEKMPVSEEVLSRWIDVARLLCDTHQRQLSLMETDTSSIPLETENVTMALQNIIFH
ncbi:histidine kinase dimerization/phospho-acceptor domain-containing protein [Vagococcus teuberi]|uniref:histidine kinase dimerization/phospho-acceptor domain-containing protein n=1 Tax=Vagococcus teuberi TaxID=519472 RepID=UPI0009FD35BB|nr:histidine kinase dimerization/phospho-acceptor domain-containing protein [Vagococcus teuberi]